MMPSDSVNDSAAYNSFIREGALAPVVQSSNNKLVYGDKNNMSPLQMQPLAEIKNDSDQLQGVPRHDEVVFDASNRHPNIVSAKSLAPEPVRSITPDPPAMIPQTATNQMAMTKNQDFGIKKKHTSLYDALSRKS